MDPSPNLLCCMAVVLEAAFNSLDTDFLIKANTIRCFMLHVYKIRYGILHCYTSYIPEIKIHIINFSCIKDTFVE